MKFRSFLGIVLTLCTSVFLASCGGGGAAPSNAGVEGGSLALLPNNPFIYAGIPTTFTITGGRTPYTLTSSDPSLIEVPISTNSHTLTVLPQNPGVIDAGLPADAVPSRTLTLTVRDATGQTATALVQVARNFLTGYGFTFETTSCSAPATGTTTTPPTGPTAGCDTVVQLSATTNGNLRGNATFKFDVVTGNFLFVDPSTGNTTTSLITQTDHNGIALVILRVPSGTPTQIGLFRVTDVASGASSTFAFNITGSNTNTLTAVPTSFTFGGADSAHCGTGSGTFFVFGGSPTYQAASSDPNVQVTPSSSQQPGVFTVTASNPNVCITTATILVTDSVGQHTTVTVTTTAGTTAAPPGPISVSPSSVTLNCGASSSVTVTGGSGTYSAAASQNNITATVSGNTVTISRVAPDPPGGPFAADSTVTVTDGASSRTVAVHSNAPAVCP